MGRCRDVCRWVGAGVGGCRWIGVGVWEQVYNVDHSSEELLCRMTTKIIYLLYNI